jgi:hypothetical protein
VALEESLIAIDIVPTSGGTPGGSDTQVQFNDGGSFGGDAGLTYNKTTDYLTGKFTSPTSGKAATEQFGNGASAVGPSDTCIGNNAITTNTASGGCTAIGANSSTTGFNNVSIGASAACSSNAGVAIGVGTTASTGAVAIGFGVTAGAATVCVGQSTSTSTNGTAVGNGATTGNAQGTAVGASASATFEAVALGYGAIVNGAGAANNGIAIGARSNTTGTAGISLGQSAVAAANEFVVGSSNAPITNVYINEGKTSTSPSNVAYNGTGGSGSNIAGSKLTFAGGKGTGTASGGDVTLQTAFSLATGSTLQSLVDRHLIVAQGKALTDNTATSLFEVALPTLKMAGGTIKATIQCTDGTDMQSYTQLVTYAAVNKAAAYTTTITTDAGNDAKAVSAGTLTTTWSILTGTNKITIQLTADTSLTPSGTNGFVVYYQVFNNSEQAITVV